VGWTDRWAARLQRKSDERLARWQERQRQRARSGRMTLMDRWAARLQRKSDERLAQWQGSERFRQPRPPWPPRLYRLLAAGMFAVAFVGVIVGAIAQTHHVRWLDELMAAVTGLGLGLGIGMLMKARRVRRASQWNQRDWVIPHKDRPPRS